MIESRATDTADVLSSALTKIKLRAFVNVALDTGGIWAVDFPAYEGFTFNVVQKGECLLTVKGEQRQVRLKPGDCFLLTGGREFSLASSVSVKKRFRAQDLFPHAADGFVSCNGGGDFFVVGTIFRFEGHLPSLLFGRLPPVIHVDGASDQAAVLRWNLDRFGAEMRGSGIGRLLILSHLAPIMLLQILRLYLSSSPREANWLVALSHPRLGKVLRALQIDYQRQWSLDELAGMANMSRSGFALIFKKNVGVAPMVYLMNWRMQIACEMLQTVDHSISAIASAVGYASESAFSAAFQKVIKCRPGTYRNQALAQGRENT